MLLAAALALIFGSGVDASSVSPGLGHAAARVPAAGLVRGITAAAVPAGRTVAALGSAVLQAATAQVSAEAAAEAAVDHMSAAQLAGQRVIYSYPGLTPPASLLTVIRQGRAAGVIFFAANYRNPAQFRAAVRELTAANASLTNPAREYPLLLMTDQEGGEVDRVPGAPAESEKQIGAVRPIVAARVAAGQAGAAAAANLASHGLNCSTWHRSSTCTGPLADFDDQYDRSYNSSPAVVSALGARFIAALQAGHVAATAKHFPGLGGAAAAQQNTDDGPVTIGASAAELAGTDESPYSAAIAAGVRLVMLSWAVYPRLGSDRPAGLSASIVQGLLRGRLGFQGVTITDAIEAGALRQYGPVPRRAALAAAAGLDLILASAQDSAEWRPGRRRNSQSAAAAWHAAGGQHRRRAAADPEPARASLRR